MGDSLTLNIAMSAHSLIYAPLYWAAKNINSNDSYRFNVDFIYGASDRGLGDRDAYNALGDNSPYGADLCVCDPMVVFEDAKNLQGKDVLQEPRGAIVGLLVQRPALWLVRINGDPDVLKGGGINVKNSVASKVRSRIKVDLGTIAMYEEGSSAHYYYDDMVENGYFESTKVLVFEMGEEKAVLGNLDPVAIRGVYEDAIPDTLVTCEFSEAYSYKGMIASMGRRSNPLLFAWHRKVGENEIPFTALVASKHLLSIKDEKRIAVTIFLRDVQKGLKYVRDMGKSHEFVESFLSRGKNENVDRDELNKQEDCFSQIFKEEYSIFPKSVHPQSLSIDRWRRACEIWRVSSDRREVNKLFKLCRESKYARLAESKSPIARLQMSVYDALHFARKSDSVWAMLFATLFVFFASLFLAKYSNKETPNWLYRTISHPGAEAWLTFILMGMVLYIRVVLRKKRALRHV